MQALVEFFKIDGAILWFLGVAIMYGRWHEKLLFTFVLSIYLAGHCLVFGLLWRLVSAVAQWMVSE